MNNVPTWRVAGWQWFTIYRIARKLDGKLNLVVWWSTFATAKLNPPIFHTCIHTIPYRTAKFKSANIFVI